MTQVVYNPDSSSNRYHYTRDDGEPLCNETRLGKKAQYIEDGEVKTPDWAIEYAQENELPESMELCGRCEQKKIKTTEVA